jgi:hypothetical protein
VEAKRPQPSNANFDILTPPYETLAAAVGAPLLAFPASIDGHARPPQPAGGRPPKPSTRRADSRLATIPLEHDPK